MKKQVKSQNLKKYIIVQQINQQKYNLQKNVVFYYKICTSNLKNNDKSYLLVMAKLVNDALNKNC